MTEKQMFDMLTASGLTEHGAAALTGNLQAESGLNPRNLQNNYERPLGHTDDTYTAAVDSGEYQNFVRDCAGYGLAQWTYWSRKQNLLNFACGMGRSIGDPEMQVLFCLQELKGYKAVWQAVTTGTDIRTISDIVLKYYENPANQSEAVKQLRAGYGQAIYARCTGSVEAEPDARADNFHPIGIYQNGSTPEPVYDSTVTGAAGIGSLDPWEKCDCLGIIDNMAMVLYRINGTSRHKVGFVRWLDGVKKL